MFCKAVRPTPWRRDLTVARAVALSACHRCVCTIVCKNSIPTGQHSAYGDTVRCMLRYGNQQVALWANWCPIHKPPKLCPSPPPPPPLFLSHLDRSPALMGNLTSKTT